MKLILFFILFCLSSFALERDLDTTLELNEPAAAYSFLNIGVTLQLDGKLALLSDAYGNSTGLGFGFGIPFTIKPIQRWHFKLMPSYQVQKLTRYIDGSSTHLVDSNPAGYTHTVKYISVLGIVGYSINNSNKMQWWLEGGAEFLTPLSATQEDSFSISQASSAGKLLYVLVGASVAMPLTGPFSLVCSSQVFYNLSSSSSKIAGARLSATFNWGN